jgi:hypothetical protein
VAPLSHKTAAFDIAVPSQTPSRRPELLQVEQQLAALLKNLISCPFSRFRYTSDSQPGPLEKT